MISYEKVIAIGKIDATINYETINVLGNLTISLETPKGNVTNKIKMSHYVR